MEFNLLSLYFALAEHIYWKEQTCTVKLTPLFVSAIRLFVFQFYQFAERLHTYSFSSKEEMLVHFSKVQHKGFL